MSRDIIIRYSKRDRDLTRRSDALQAPIVGVEVRPRLKNSAAKGVVDALTSKNVTFSNGQFHLAEFAAVTHSTRKKTVITVAPRYNGGITPVNVAHAVGELIDPIGSHNVVYEARTPQRPR
jgi:hypothetical protein